MSASFTITVPELVDSLVAEAGRGGRLKHQATGRMPSGPGRCEEVAAPPGALAETA